MHPLWKNKATKQESQRQAPVLELAGRVCCISAQGLGPSLQPSPPGARFPAYHCYTAPVWHSFVMTHQAPLSPLPVLRTQYRTYDCLWLLALELRGPGLEVSCFVLTQAHVPGTLRACRIYQWLS